MSTPVEELANPFGDSAMAESPEGTSSSGGVVTSAEGGTPAAPGDKPKGKKKVGFTGGEEVDPSGKRSSFAESQGNGSHSPFDLSPKYGSPAGSGHSTPSGHRRQSSGDQLLPPENDRSHLPRLSEQKTEQLYEAISRNLDIPRPRPAIRKGNSSRPEEPWIETESPGDDERHRQRQQSARKAFERGKDIERVAQAYSNPVSRRSSPDGRIPSIAAGDIPLQDLDDKDSEDEATDFPPQLRKASTAEAFNLVRRHTNPRHAFKHTPSEPQSGRQSGAVTPTEDQQFMEDYMPHPDQYRGGILGSLLKLYGDPNSSTSRKGPSRPSSGDFSAMSSPAHSPPESGATTPTYNRRWYSHRKDDNQSTSSLATLVGTSSSFGSAAVSNRDLGEEVSKRLREQQQKRPGAGKRTSSGGMLNRFSRPRLQEEYRITAHIAGTIARQKYLQRLCRALMQYGAPTHRLEEYMTMSARVLEIEAQFLYIPGAMIMSFEDRETHTSEVKLVKVAQGLDLGKLRDVHEVYKEVVHDKLGVEEAHGRLKEVSNRDPKHNRFVRIPVYGLAAVCVGPFAFGARLIDLPIAFVLGCILGFLQLYVAPASDLYANVFEISAAVITSFLARAFGSIRGGNLFCFSALAQSSIALILPGYTVLCASLELQSRSIVAGSVRMVYAIIYSLFLGFGITIGTAIYGILDKNATSETTCKNQIPEYWFFFFVPGFTMCLIVINQAKWKQAPVMMIIAFAGYVVNYFSARRFSGNTQVSNTLGALAIGVLANLYSRIGGRIENRGWDLWEERLRPRWKAFRKRIFGHHSRNKSPKSMEEGKVIGDNESIRSNFQPAARRVGYGLAAAAMLPAIFVQVPSGLAVNGSLVAGIASANQITGNATNGTTVVNSTSISTAAEGLNSIAFTVGYSVVQVAIGITVGLFLSAIVVYPFGKRRSGLFSF
ncbi:hypothetical protein DOTSEDRAFT_68236 [Dothistroma septosporum NZE10]|uniref:Threonine/serine exporter-like N-terminal domain-containing protein n=1 Tax=Dothistroma septosporum (strain NZE10 / CBS 128990) TaxID=675120 RepID=N1Q491_DOTSN|nr:hypothetical protein DOTSEDRAFT_68236 [Dothistroma septosporum NZE10]